MSSPNACSECAVVFESLSPASEVIPKPHGFFGVGMGAGRMAEQGQQETALWLFINWVETELK